eukprot:tig00020610_g11950.t1
MQSDSAGALVRPPWSSRSDRRRAEEQAAGGSFAFDSQPGACPEWTQDECAAALVAPADEAAEFESAHQCSTLAASLAARYLVRWSSTGARITREQLERARSAAPAAVLVKVVGGELWVRSPTAQELARCGPGCPADAALAEGVVRLFHRLLRRYRLPDLEALLPLFSVLASPAHADIPFPDPRMALDAGCWVEGSPWRPPDSTARWGEKEPTLFWAGPADAGAANAVAASRYRFLTAPASRGWSRSFRALLASGSLVFKPESPFFEFFYPLLRPWTHYVPLGEDASDGAERAEWARRHDAAARRIAAQGAEAVRAALRFEDVLCYLRRLLEGYAALLDFAPAPDPAAGDRRAPLPAPPRGCPDPRLAPFAPGPPRGGPPRSSWLPTLPSGPTSTLLRRTPRVGPRARGPAPCPRCRRRRPSGRPAPPARAPPLLLAAGGLAVVAWVAAHSPPRARSLALLAPALLLLAALVALALLPLSSPPTTCPAAPPPPAAALVPTAPCDSANCSALVLEDESGPPPLRVYVYELPARFNTELMAPACASGPFAADAWLHSHLSGSWRRTWDGEAADFFLLPVYTGCGMGVVYPLRPLMRDALLEAVAYARAVLPYWDRRPADHMLVFPNEFGSCVDGERLVAETPRGAQRPPPTPLQPAIFLQHSGDYFTPCYSAAKDVVLPALGPIARDPARSGALLAAARAAAGRPRPLLAFFSGAFEGLPLREALWRLYAADERVRLVREAPCGGTGPCEEAGGEGLEASLLDASFCLVVPGWADWSPRLGEAILAGCVPVLVGDGYDLPYARTVPYPAFALYVGPSERDLAGLRRRLEAVPEREVAARRARALEAADAFRWCPPGRGLGEGAPGCGALDALFAELAARRRLLSRARP